MGIFNWFKSNESNDDNMKTKYKRTSRPTIDYTDDLSVNDSLTKGIYRNTYQGMKLAGFGFNIINVPVSFMGLPVINTQDEDIQAIITDRVRECRSIHTQCHRDGTLWVYPEYSYERGLIWKMIPDQIVTMVYRDIETDLIKMIITEEEIVINEIGYDAQNTIVRKVTYTLDEVTTTYSGTGAPADSKSVNVAGVLPVNFTNNADLNENRGHSDYERLLADLKAYHDTDLAASTALVKFSVKMVQSVTDVDNWLDNNGFDDLSDLDIGDIDLIINQTDEETSFVFPTDVIGAFSSKQKMIFHKLVELSGIPEIAWGLKTEGNLASVEENMAMLMQYCRDKQEQKIEPYTKLVNASIRLMNMAGKISSIEEVTVNWDVLESTSAETKANVFQMYASALASLIDKAGMTKEQLYRFWKINFPSLTEEEFDEWSTQLGLMVTHTVQTKSTATDLLLAQGVVDE